MAQNRHLSRNPLQPVARTVAVFQNIEENNNYSFSPGHTSSKVKYDLTGVNYKHFETVSIDKYDRTL